MEKYIYKNGGNKMISKLECMFEDYKERELLLCSSAVDYIIYKSAKYKSFGIYEWGIDKHNRELFECSGYYYYLYDMFQNESRKKIIEYLLNYEGVFVTYAEKVKLFGCITIYNSGGILFTV